MKKKSRISSSVVCCLMLLALSGTAVFAAAITSASSGNWSATAWPNTTRTGTITTSTSSTIVSGTGTSFTTEISVGNIVKTTGNVTIGTVASIQSNTQLTLNVNAASNNTDIAYNSQGVGSGDAVTIASGHTVTVDVGTANALSITINAMTAAGTNGITLNANTLNTGSLAIAGSGNAGRFSTLSVSTGTINCTGNISFSGTVAQARIVFSGVGILNLGGNLGTGGTFTAGTSTVNCTGTTAQTVAGYTYNVLKSNNTAGVTLVAAATITTLTIGDVTAGSVFNDGGYTITPGTGSVLNLTDGTYNLGSAGTATTWPAWGTRNIATGTTVGYISSVAQTVSATPTYQNLLLGGAGAKTITGLTGVTGNFTLSGTATVTLPNGFSIGGDLAINTTGGTGITIGNGNAITVTDDVSGTGTLTTGNQTRTINLAGNWTHTGTATGTGLTVVCNGTGTQTITGTNTMNVTVNKTSGEVQLLDDKTIGTLLMTAGIFNPNGSLANITTLTFNGGTLKVPTGTWAESYSVTTTPAAGTTIEYTNAAATIDGAITYQNLTYSGSGTAGASAALTIQGNLSNTGGGTLNFGAYNITLNGTVTAQSIDGFTTTGGMIVGKTGGTATVDGNVNAASLAFTGANNSSLALATGVIVTISGALTMPRPASAAVTFNVDGGSFSCASITLSATSTTFARSVTVSISTGTVTVSGNITCGGIYSYLTFTDAGTLNLGGNLGAGGTFTASTGTVNCNGTAAQTGAGYTYNILKSNNTAGVSMVAATTITTLTIGDATSGSVFNDGGFTITPGTGSILNLTDGTYNLGSAGTATTWPAWGTRNIATGTTVGYISSIAQTVSATPAYQNLTLGGALAKTVTSTSIAGTLIMSGTATVTLPNGFSIGGNMALNTTSGTGVTISTGNSATVTGGISGSGTLTIGGTGIINVGGDWTHSGTFTVNQSSVNYNGTQNGQVVRGGITYYNLEISNGGTKVLSGDITVSNTLTLTSGILKLYDYDVVVNTVASINGTYSSTSMIQTNGAGYLQKNGTQTDVGITYPVGAGGFYNPFVLSGFTATGTGSVQISATTEDQGSSTLSKYWTLTVTGYTSNIAATLSYAFQNAEVHGTKSTYTPWYSTNAGTTWITPPGTPTPAGANPFGTTVTNATSITGRWTAGTNAPGPAVATSFYSYQSGDWADASTWTTDASGTLWINPGVPGSIDNATILNGRTITINTNTKVVASLTIVSGGILDIKSTTGHNFGTVTGQGKIMLSSVTFPGGTFTNFLASNGGTIEYYNLNNIGLPTVPASYNNLIISNYTGSANTCYLNNTNDITYTINGNFNLKNYSSGSETFYFGNPTASVSSNLIDMEVYGNFTVDAGCNIRVNNFAGPQAVPDDQPATVGDITPYHIHSLTLYGNFTNNGSVRFTGLPAPFVEPGYYTNTSTAYGGVNYGDVQVFFKGASNNTVTCNGTTDFYRFIVEKGTDKTYTLEVNSSSTNNFALYGPSNQGSFIFDGGPEGFGYGVYYKALFIHYGTLKLNENIYIRYLSWDGQDFNIIPTAGLWVNGATVYTGIVCGGDQWCAATLYGSLRVSAGMFSTGDAGGIVLGTAGTPVIQVEGTGTLSVSQAWTAAGGTNQMSYIQSGGTANFHLQGTAHPGPALSLSNVNSAFIMTGGTINFTNNTFAYGGTTDYAIINIQAQVGNYQVTGGTINLNLPSSATTYYLNSTVPFYNLNISRRTGAATVLIRWDTPSSSLNVLHDLTVGSNTTLNLATNAIDLAVGHNFTIESGGTYSPSTTGTTTFNGTTAQAFNNIGTITGAALQNLTITNTSTTSVLNNHVTVNGALTVDQSAAVSDNGFKINIAGNVTMSGTHTGLSSHGIGGIYLTGTAAQNIYGTGTGVFNNLILEKTGGSVTVNANMTVTGDLCLSGNATGTRSILNMQSYNLALGLNAMVYSDTNSATTFSATRMIQTDGALSNGGVSKTFSNTAAFVYPFGISGSYLPASIQYSSAPSAYGTVTVKPVNGRHPLAQGTNNALTCFWKTTSSGFTGIPAGSVKHIYYYTTGFVVGTEGSYTAAYSNGSAWISDINLTVNSTSHLISYTAGNAADGEFTAGLSSAFGIITTLYSCATGNWEDPLTWSTQRALPRVAGGTPVTTTPVVICNSYTVTTTGSASSSQLTIETGATLNLGALQGHTFGTIVHDATTGCGTLRIASTNYFPTGDWTYFLGASGGTVEYYQTTTGSTFALPVGNTSYYNLITSPYDGSTITLPNANLTVYNNYAAGFAGASPGSGMTRINSISTTTVEVMGNITVSGVLQYMNGVAENIIADKDITIASTGALQVNSTGTIAANSLTVYGNIVNNGIFDLNPTADVTRYCTLTFKGTLNTSISNATTPTRTRFYSITMDKGTTMSPVMNVNIDNTGFFMGAGGLTLVNGTFRLTTAGVTMNASTGGFTIPSTACLSANTSGGTLNIITTDVAADVTLNGKLEVLAGTVNVGQALTSASANAFNIVYAIAGTPEIYISGGSLNVFTQIRRGTVNTSGSLTYTQSGGTVTIGGKNPATARAAFEILNGGSNFTMSNGTLILANHIVGGTNYDLYLDPDVENVTGGTIQFGFNTTVTTQKDFTFKSLCSIGNIVLEATTNATVTQQVFELNLVGSLTIGGATGYYNTNALDVFIGGNFTNNNTTSTSGSLTVGGFQTQSASQFTAFLGNADQTIAGTGSGHTNFANLEVATAAGRSLFLSTSVTSNITVNGSFTLTSGTLNDGANTVNIKGNVDNNAVHYSPNATTGGMIFNGTANQGITGNGTGVFGNVEINNGGNDVNMTDNTTMDGQLKFTNGSLYIDNYALTLGQNASIAGSLDNNNMITLNGVAGDAGVTKVLPANFATSFTLPIGDNGKYTPCTFAFTSSNNDAGATIKVVPVDNVHPTVTPESQTNYLVYYWNVTSTGFTSKTYTVTHTYTYVFADLVGTIADSYIERYVSPTWEEVTGTKTTSSPYQFSVTNAAFLNGSYTIGDHFLGLKTLFSRLTGDWDNTTTVWSETRTGGPCGYAPNGHPVVLQNGHTISLSANAAYATSVEIEVGSVLDAKNTTYHNIGTVSGGGKIRLLGSGDHMFVFPGGSYDEFLATPGTIVEYYGDDYATMPLTPGNLDKPYQNVLLTGTGIKYISAVGIKILGNLTISDGSKLNNTLYNKDVILVGNWNDYNSTTPGFTAGTGSVHFSGTSAQTITMAGNTMKETFYNLEINNVSGLTIPTGTVDVDNQLSLTSGYITTNSTNTLTINNTGTGAVIGGSVNSFVNGPLSKKIMNGSSFLFPVGDTVTQGRKRYGYVSVTGTVTSGTQIWTAQFYDQTLTAGGFTNDVTSPLQSVITNEFWKVIGPTGGSANVVLSWDQYTGMSSSTSTRQSDTRVAEWNAPTTSTWITVGDVVNDGGQYSGTASTSTAVSLGTHYFTIGAMSVSVVVTAASGGGNWTSTSTWTGGAVPRQIDKVQIGSGVTVTLNTNPTVAQLTVEGSLTNGTDNYTVSVEGDFTLNGIWSNNGTGTSKISLTSTSGTIFGTTGSITGTGTSMLEIAGNTSIDATATLTLPNVSILAGKTLSNKGTVTLTTLSSGGTLENKAGSTLIFMGANMDAITLTASECANSVVYAGTVSQAVKATTHCTIIFRNAGAKTISNGTQAHGDVIQEATATSVSVNSDVVMQIDGGLVTGEGFINNGDITINN